jgi:uncharacterized protein YlxW (UPF0749 family)
MGMGMGTVPVVGAGVIIVFEDQDENREGAV